MLTDRDAVEAADLQRRRVLAAFTTGSAADPDVLARRPNRAVVGGVALTVFACLGTGVGGLLTDHVPKDWAAKGTVVVRRSTGVHYVSTGGQLRQVRNGMSLALAGLAHPRLVRVDATRFRTRPLGTPFGIDGAPAQRPQVPADDVPWWACERPGQAIALLTAGGPTGGTSAVLGRVGGTTALVLVAGGVSHPVASQVAEVLGYDPRRARPLPSSFTALLTQGRPLVRLPRPAPPAAVPPAAAFLAAGTLVQDTGDNSLYVADAGQLRPVAGTTALRLLYGARLPAPVRLPTQVRSAAPAGPPLAVPGFPAAPPAVAPAGSWICVTSAGGVLSAPAALPVLGLEAVGPPGHAYRATVWQPAGVASLVRSAPSIRSAVTRAHPLQLVAEGRAFPVPDEAALGLLGCTDTQVHPRPPAWLTLLRRGPALVPLSLQPAGTG